MTVAALIAAIGVSLVVRGADLAWRPAGWILAGLAIALPAVFVAYDAFRSK